MSQRTADYRINETTFRVTYGDLSQVEAEALVSSDDNYLTMSGGVSLALLKAGGNVVRQDADKHIPLKIGDVVVTSAGRLPARYIFHAVTIDHDNIISPDENSVCEATLKCMKLANALHVPHLAFPALGTGSGGFPFQSAAEVMTRTIADYLNENTDVKRVTLTLYSKTDIEESELNLFYERAVALASVSSQGKRLNALLAELRNVAEEIQQPGIAKDIRQLQAQLIQAQQVMTQNSATSDNLDQLQDRSGIARISQQVLDFSAQAQTSIGTHNRQLEAQVLRTKLDGFLTQLNILYSNLNKLQIKKAKYGIDVPIYVENSIDDLQGEIDEIEARVEETRTQIAGLTAHP